MGGYGYARVEFTAAPRHDTAVCPDDEPSARDEACRNKRPARSYRLMGLAGFGGLVGADGSGAAL